MELFAEGREYAHFRAVEGLPDSPQPLEVSFDWGVTWNTCLPWDDGIAKLLVAGPDATGNPPGTVVLDPATLPHRYNVLCRQPDVTEVIVRAGGIIDVLE